MKVCNHNYAALYRNRPTSLGRQCRYPQLYARLRATGPPPADEDVTPFLPIDDHGACVFHSRELVWKRQNDFTGKFLQLIHLLDEHDVDRYYDFAEFVFLGTDLITKSGAEQYLLRLTDMVFRKQAYFTGALFLDSLELERIDFRDGASFDQATFQNSLTLAETQARGLDFTAAKFTDGVTFKGVSCLSFGLFSKATFAATRRSALVLFKDSRFDGITDFSDADFTLGDQSAVCFENVEFEDCVDFRNTHFNCQVEFSEVSFADKTEFTDTSFDMVRSTARYRGTAVEFNRIQVATDAVLSFISTDAHHKMFNHDVQMSFKEDPSGTIRFENVNLHLFTQNSKERLTRLAKLGRVEIGSGCIKYRFQTSVRTIQISESNTPLILELCQTFANYFTVSNGLNLGFEIVERSKTQVSFFYFTDENTSEEVFHERLAKTTQCLLDLLSIGSEEQLLDLEGPTGATLATGKESALINAVDAISAMLGTFFRVSARIALGRWNEADTAALLNVLPLDQKLARDSAAGLHQLLEDRYTRRRLFGLSAELNERVFLKGKLAALTQTVQLLAGKREQYVMGDHYEISSKNVGRLAVGPGAAVDEITLNQPHHGESVMQGKIKILFLAANPSDTSPLRLGEEIRQIDEKISLGRNRDAFELIQQHALRAGDLQRVLLKYQPHIVHFSGHGSAAEEIVLEDNLGHSKAVAKEALAQLFEILKDNVRVVVLNACFSRAQAEALNDTIDYTIGMKKTVGDKTAIAFAGAFYQALAFDRTVSESFKLATLEPALAGLAGSDTPELFVRAGAEARGPLISQENK